PHQVNLGRPWEVEISAQAAPLTGGKTDGATNSEIPGGDKDPEIPGKIAGAIVAIQVPDPNPGRTFYLLTEDCETFDGGLLTGDYPSRGMHIYGNQNNFMDPEDYRVQMILKPARLNQIAERHGARWTHFYAATQRFGAEWAARQ